MSTEDSVIPFDLQREMEENDWTDAEQEAWTVLHEARPGEYVLWADRSVAMEVVSRSVDSDGNATLEVDKPRGEGTYTVRERYDGGDPAFTSDIGNANDLHFVERLPEPRGLSEDEYERLVQNISDNAIDSFRRLDYGDWEDAVDEVVESWSQDVALRDWRGYKHHPDWEDGDAEAIFESVVEHALEDGGGGRPVQPEGEDGLSARKQAEVVLSNRVYTQGKQDAEASIITSKADYEDIVDTLAHHTMDRSDRKAYSDIRTAGRDTISDWIDDRSSPVYQAIIQYGTDRFEDKSVYSGLDEPDRELAFDILEHDVWEVTQEYQRDRGEHDPTLRGLTYTNFNDLKDHLVGESMRLYNGEGLLRTTVKRVVEQWADSVEAEEWDGHRHRVYAEGDVEDIFSSVAIHADNDPMVFNPFSRHKERKMAVNALIPEVHRATANAIDERGEEGATYPADDYIEDQLGMDVGYDDLHSAERSEVYSFLSSAIESAEGDEVGWTFVEEIIEMGGVVPESTNDWTLIDYGVIREGDRIRKLAWFDRETGDLLILSGLVSEDIDALIDGDFDGDPYDQFHVQRVQFGDDEPEFLLSDAPLEDALDFVYDFLDADQADLRVIETEDDVFVEDAITDDDINAHGVLDALVPNISIGPDDVTALAGSSFRGAGGVIKRYWTEISGVAALAALISGHWYLGGTLLGTNLKPSIHKKKGVGVKGSKELGSSKSNAGVGGTVETELYVRNETFSNLADEHAPEFIKHGFREGDIGKGPAIAAGNALGTFRDTLAYTFEDDAVPEIRNSDVDSMSLEELQELADRTDRTYSDEQYEDRDTLASTLYGYADHYEPERVSWGQAFLDTYGSSVERLESALRRGAQESIEEDDLQNTQNVEAVADVDSDLSDEMGYQPGEYDPDDFSWADLRRTEDGLSGILLRGLEAEDVVATADFLNVEEWLSDTLHRGVRHGSDFIQSEAPTFEEWQEERFGPGKDGGPEAEARRRARYHKEVAAAEDPPDPFNAMGVNDETLGEIEDQPDELGDYNNSQYDSDDSSAGPFEEVAERFRSDEPVEDDAEFEDGHE